MLSIHSSPLGALGTRDTGGMSVYLRHVSRHLGSAGHGVDIFTCAGASAPPLDLAANVRLIRIGPGALAEMPKEHLADQVPAIFAALEAFRSQNGLDYDLIHSHYWISGLVGQMAQARWRRPHLAMFHTLGAAKNTPGSGENESARRVAAERRLAAAADRIVAPSAGEAGHLMGLYGVPQARISVVPCGVDLDLFQPRGRAAGRRRLGWPAGEETMLFVGRPAPLKGLENLIEALALLRPRHPRLTLRVVGGDDAQGPPAAIRRAQALGVAEAVAFMGRIEQTDLPFYYSAADLLALPSYYESFGLVVLEALACGTPVAATAVGVVPAVIQAGWNGVVLAGPAPDAIARGVAALLAVPRDPQRAAQIRRTVEKYDWPSVAADIETLYRQILSGRN
jgi:D-inositol-3-phosphate glycosyltransferase